MSNAHKGSKLILDGQVIPVDFQSSHFEFSNTTTGICAGELIEPRVDSVFTHRPIEGKFGGAIAVEETTTNYANYDIRTYTLGDWSAGSGGTIQDGVTGWGEPFRAIIPATTSSSNLVLTGNLTLPSPSGSSFTGSFYYYTEGQNPYIGLRSSDSAYYTNSSQGNQKIIQLANGWKRLIFTWNIPSNYAGTNTFQYLIRTSENTVPTYFSMPQIEKKAFATSAVNGSRGHGGYLLDKGMVFNPNSGTISFWMNPLERKPNLYSSFISLGGYSADKSVDWLSVYYGSGWGSGNRICLALAEGISKQSLEVPVTPTILENTWYFVVARWDVSTKVAKITVYNHSTGEKFVNTGTIPFSTAPRFLNQNLINIGKVWGNPNTPACEVNALISDLLIDKYFISDEDCDIRFVSDSPLYNPYDYRANAT